MALYCDKMCYTGYIHDLVHHRPNLDCFEVGSGVEDP